MTTQTPLARQVEQLEVKAMQLESLCGQIVATFEVNRKRWSDVAKDPEQSLRTLFDFGAKWKDQYREICGDKKKGGDA